MEMQRRDRRDSFEHLSHVERNTGGKNRGKSWSLTFGGGERPNEIISTTTLQNVSLHFRVLLGDPGSWHSEEVGPHAGQRVLPHKDDKNIKKWHYVGSKWGLSSDWLISGVLHTQKIDCSVSGTLIQERIRNSSHYINHDSELCAWILEIQWEDLMMLQFWCQLSRKCGFN